jgi:hypothetical protein
LLGLGSALVKTKDIDAAIAALAKAAPLVRTMSAYNRLGVAHTLAGSFSVAEASFEAAQGLANSRIASTASSSLAVERGSECLKLQRAPSQGVLSQVIGSPLSLSKQLRGKSGGCALIADDPSLNLHDRFARNTIMTVHPFGVMGNLSLAFNGENEPCSFLAAQERACAAVDGCLLAGGVACLNKSRSRRAGCFTTRSPQLSGQ